MTQLKNFSVRLCHGFCQFPRHVFCVLLQRIRTCLVHRTEQERPRCRDSPQGFRCMQISLDLWCWPRRIAVFALRSYSETRAESTCDRKITFMHNLPSLLNTFQYFQRVFLFISTCFGSAGTPSWPSNDAPWNVFFEGVSATQTVVRLCNVSSLDPVGKSELLPRYRQLWQTHSASALEVLSSLFQIFDRASMELPSEQHHFWS